MPAALWRAARVLVQVKPGTEGAVGVGCVDMAAEAEAEQRSSVNIDAPLGQFFAGTDRALLLLFALSAL